MANMKKYLPAIMIGLALCALFSGSAAAYDITAGSDTLYWNISSSETLTIHENGPCTQSGNTFTCNYIMTDPPFGLEMLFNATITPQNVVIGQTPQLFYYYIDIIDNSHFMGWKACAGGCKLEIADTFILPGRLKQLQLTYESDIDDPDKKKIYVNIEMAYYDLSAAILNGGPDINRDTAYCGSGTTPGPDPRGAGPGD